MNRDTTDAVISYLPKGSKLELKEYIRVFNRERRSNGYSKLTMTDLVVFGLNLATKGSLPTLKYSINRDFIQWLKNSC
jgi:hypothetical protein